MAAPKPSTVVLILVVFACVAFYVLGLGLGATDNSRPGRPSMSKQERTSLRERFLRPRAVKPDEFQTDCPLADGVLTIEAGRTCQVEISEGGLRGRTLEVAPAGPGAGGVSLEFQSKGKPALPISEDLLREPRELDVMKEGARLAITCRNVLSGGGRPGRCQVRLQ